MSEQHTPTPWALFGSDKHIMGVEYKEAIRRGVNHAQWTHNCSKEDARRVVACVNACEGIPTDALIATCDDANDLKDFDLAAHALIERVGLRGELELARKQRDELITALKDIAEWTERYTKPDHPISAVARKAIAKAESV